MVVTMLLDLFFGSLSRQIFDCRDKCSIDFSGTLLTIFATKFE